MVLLDKDVLIAGQLFTSRTETLEDYLINKVRNLGVIGFVSCFLPSAWGRLSLYKNGKLEKKSKLLSFYIKDYSWYRRPLVIIVFLVYLLDILYSMVVLRRKFDLFIGVACFSAFMGVVLKKLGLTRDTVYYCLDYYVPEKKLTFNSLFVRAINRIDRFVVNNSDAVWNLSVKLSEAKAVYLKSEKKTIIVPLGYSSKLKREVPFNRINRWDIVFVGTLTFNQGLQLLVDILPEIIKTCPGLKVNIIGQGPFSQELKQMVKARGLSSYFIFYGFIEEEMMLDVVSRSALGLAVWDDSLENENVKFADPGKLKLYAICGIPMVTTKVAPLADKIINRQMGLVVEYRPQALIGALDYLLKNDEALSLYRKNATSFGKECTSEYIFDDAFQKTAKILDNFKK